MGPIPDVLTGVARLLVEFDVLTNEFLRISSTQIELSILEITISEITVSIPACNMVDQMTRSTSDSSFETHPISHRTRSSGSVP